MPLPFGLAAQRAISPTQTTAHTAMIHGWGRFQFSRFRMRPPVSPSPKARGIPATMRRPVARLSREAE